MDVYGEALQLEEPGAPEGHSPLPGTPSEGVGDRGRLSLPFREDPEAFKNLHPRVTQLLRSRFWSSTQELLVFSFISLDEHKQTNEGTRSFFFSVSRYVSYFATFKKMILTLIFIIFGNVTKLPVNFFQHISHLDG